MAKKAKAVAYICRKCRAEGSYYGRLVFDRDNAGNCPHHKNEALVPAPPAERKA